MCLPRSKRPTWDDLVHKISGNKASLNLEIIFLGESSSIRLTSNKHEPKCVPIVGGGELQLESSKKFRESGFVRFANFMLEGSIYYGCDNLLEFEIYDIQSVERSLYFRGVGVRYDAALWRRWLAETLPKCSILADDAKI